MSVMFFVNHCHKNLLQSLSMLKNTDISAPLFTTFTCGTDFEVHKQLRAVQCPCHYWVLVTSTKICVSAYRRDLYCPLCDKDKKLTQLHAWCSYKLVLTGWCPTVFR